MSICSRAAGDLGYPPGAMWFVACLLLLVMSVASCGPDKGGGLSGDAEKGIADVGPPIQKVSLMSILSAMERGRYAEGELLVKFRPGVMKTTVLKAHQVLGASVIKGFFLVHGLDHIKLPPGITVKEAIVRYMSDQDVEYAQPNYIKKAVLTPNDAYFTQQWGLQKINAPQAWDITTGNSSVTVAVIDTGIDYNHPDLGSNIWANAKETNCSDGADNDGNGYVDDCRGWDFTRCATFNASGYCTSPKSPDNNPMDDNGHGTHVAGIIGAVGNNGVGVAGVGWGIRLMPLKFLNADGEGTDADEIEAIQYAISNGARIINASFSGPSYSQAEYDAIASASNAGVIVIAAAGNGGDDAVGDNNDVTPEYPASYNLPNIISVAATDQNDARPAWSNYGQNSVHVAAPGSAILSTYLSGYIALSGTSMSTPFVSGLAGLLYSYYTDFTYSQIRSTILRYVDTLPTLSGWIKTGGRVNAFKAVSSLSAPTNLTATAITSSAISLSWTDNATGEDGYKLERKIGTGPYTEITTLSANATSYTNSGLTDGTLYTYRVRAYNTIPADSSYSNSAVTVTPLNSPTGLTATALSGSQVKLTWADNSQSEDGYKIERRGSDGNYSQIAVVGPNTATYTDSGLNQATTYWYRVRAYNGAAGDSLYSNEASVTTLTAGGEGSGGGGGGGGCSIGIRQDGKTSGADIAVLFISFLIISVMRRRR